MGQFTVEISPRVIMTSNRNRLQVTVGFVPPASLREVALTAECRLMAAGVMKESYLLGEKRFSEGELSGGPPLRLEWEIELTRKGPLTFKSEAFSVEHFAAVEVKAGGGQGERFEVPLTVVPGRLTAAPAER